MIASTPPESALDRIRLAAVTGELPDGFGDLRLEASAEGHGFVERLASDWAAGTMRFDGPGERLLAASVDGDLAGVGGLTTETIAADALRMRRFYVRASHRRGGVGRRLASALLDHARGTARLVTVNAQAASFPFWESLGFVRVTREGITHMVRLGADRAR